MSLSYYTQPMDWRIAALLIVLGALLAGALIAYCIVAIKNRGKPRPERLGHGNLGGMAGYSGRGPGAGGPAGSSPGAFALYGRKDPNRPQDEAGEDPQRR